MCAYLLQARDMLVRRLSLTILVAGVSVLTRNGKQGLIFFLLFMPDNSPRPPWEKKIKNLIINLLFSVLLEKTHAREKNSSKRRYNQGF